jgi:hypothetical protein
VELPAPRAVCLNILSTAEAGNVAVRLLQFGAIMLTALALVPAGAHFFELPNKIGLDQEAYFTVQAIYRGWALFGVALFGALFANLALGLVLAFRQRPYALPLLAFALIAATLAIFFVWTYPANQATSNWTLPTPNWTTLRMHWEYAHAVNAVLTFVALCLLTWSVVRAKD